MNIKEEINKKVDLYFTNIEVNNILRVCDSSRKKNDLDLIFDKIYKYGEINYLFILTVNNMYLFPFNHIFTTEETEFYILNYIVNHLDLNPVVFKVSVSKVKNNEIDGEIKEYSISKVYNTFYKNSKKYKGILIYYFQNDKLKKYIINNKSLVDSILQFNLETNMMIEKYLYLY